MKCSFLPLEYFVFFERMTNEVNSFDEIFCDEKSPLSHYAKIANAFLHIGGANDHFSSLFSSRLSFSLSRLWYDRPDKYAMAKIFRSFFRFSSHVSCHLISLCYRLFRHHWSMCSCPHWWSLYESVRRNELRRKLQCFAEQSSSNDSNHRVYHQVSWPAPCVRSVAEGRVVFRYVSKIKSSDKFIDNVLGRQQGPVGKMNVLTFLYRCFRLAQSAIERDLSQMLEPSNKKPTSLISATLTIEQLQKAQYQLTELQHTIKKRIDLLQTWIPPTIPFLGV